MVGGCVREMWGFLVLVGRLAAWFFFEPLLWLWSEAIFFYTYNCCCLLLHDDDIHVRAWVIFWGGLWGDGWFDDECTSKKNSRAMTTHVAYARTNGKMNGCVWVCEGWRQMILFGGGPLRSFLRRRKIAPSPSFCRCIFETLVEFFIVEICCCLKIHSFVRSLAIDTAL